MKTIGLIGGMSWESTVEYYRILNQEVSKRLGGFHSAKIAMVSLNFQEIESLFRENRWDRITDRLAEGAKQTEAAGADFTLIGCNTMHKVAREVEERVNRPILDIIDVTAQAIRRRNVTKVGLLGTRFAMEDGFYPSRLQESRLEVLIPTKEERQLVDRVIFQELAFGHLRPQSRMQFQTIIHHLVERGAEAVILGCTEIPTLVREEDSPVPLLNTTRLHAQAAVDRALQEVGG